MEFLITDAAKLSAPLGRDSDSDAGQRRYRRLLQHLVVEGVIYPIGDAHRGRGSHRRFDLMETQLAAIAFHMCDLLRVPVGTVEHAIINLRGKVEQTPAIFETPMAGFKSSIELYTFRYFRWC